METNKANQVITQFNETIQQWINYLDDYTLATLCQKPHHESWSLGQVYIHIINDTTFFIEQMKLALLNNADSEKEMHEDAKVMFANNAFPDRVLVGPATNSSVRQPQSKEQLRQSLVSIKDEVNRLYLTCDVERTTGKTQHPGLLFFTAAEWLQFADMHMRHHFRQKKRIDDAFK